MWSTMSAFTTSMSATTLAEIRCEQPIELGKRNGIGEPGERSLLGNAGGCAHERGPCGAGQRTTDADAARAQRGELGDGHARAGDQHIDGLRRHRLYHGA